MTQVAKPQIKNDRFLKALRREPVDRTPIWMMRQAGRYLPEYRETRAKAGDFMSLCKNAELACEVTMQPIRRYGFDAAILFSDILTIPDAMGLGLHFVQGEGPQFTHPVRQLADIQALPELTAEVDLDYVMRAVSTIKQALNQEIPLIGFTGSPWTLACYMVNGSGSKDGFARVQRMAYEQPEAMQLLLAKLVDAVSDYLLAQVAAGADALQIFDTWGGLLSYEDYLSLSLNPMRLIVERVKAKYPEIPIIVFTKGGGVWLEEMADIGCDGLGLDWTVHLGQARERVGSQVALQGNLSPVILNAPTSVVEAKTKAVLDQFGAHPGHIFNLGHGITPKIDPEHVRVMVETVKNYRATPSE